eukprot:3694575-Amphidinium_carterae.1
MSVTAQGLQLWGPLREFNRVVQAWVTYNQFPVITPLHWGSYDILMRSGCVQCLHSTPCRTVGNQVFLFTLPPPSQQFFKIDSERVQTVFIRTSRIINIPPHMCQGWSCSRCSTYSPWYRISGSTFKVYFCSFQAEE